MTRPRDEGACDDMPERVMEWVAAGVPVDTIVVRVRRHLPDQPSRGRLIKELRRRARVFWTENRWGRSQHLERVVEALERPPGA